MIKKGDKFRCIKTMQIGNFDPWYLQGKIYTSELDGCITDEEGDIDNEIGREDSGYFVPYISNKRRGYGRKKRKTV